MMKRLLISATNAVNGEKFTRSYTRETGKTLYQVQSEADFSLIDMIAFYTQNRNQIVRIFRASALGYNEIKLQH